LPALDIAGFDHACGDAVDSEGDVYVASAGASKIHVFDPEHNELTAISNSKEPCGLAVDGKGNLYVSEKQTGEVVKYVPSAYPFSGVPTYSSPTAIDASGAAKGISVDPFDDRLYVAKGDRVDSYSADGTFTLSIGLGDLTNATGVGAYTYAGAGDFRYVFAADSGSNEIEIFGAKEITGLTLQKTVDGSDADAFKADQTPDNGIGFGPAGSSVAVDWTSGHFFVYDDAHQVVDEFEATGQYVTQIVDSRFVDSEPTGIAAFPERNEVQRLKTTCSGGSFTLSFEAQTTISLPCEATDAEIELALESLSTIGADNVAVFGGYSNPNGSYAVAFSDQLGKRNVGQIVADGSALTGGGTASISTESQGSGPGRVYVTAGTGAGAKLLTFAALAPAARSLRGDLSLTLQSTCGIAVDNYGNRYVAADKRIYIYNSAGNEIKVLGPKGEEGLLDSRRPCDLAVDSACNVYALDRETPPDFLGAVVYYAPDSCPPKLNTKYSAPTTVAVGGPPYFEEKSPIGPYALGINPVTGHVYVNQHFTDKTIELDSAKNGSAILNAHWAPIFLSGERGDIGVCGTGGEVFVAGSGSSGTIIHILDPSGTKIVSRITGGGSPKGALPPHTRVAVDQVNCHALLFANARGVAEEYESSGAFVAEFGSFTTADTSKPYGIAVDNSCYFDEVTPSEAACGLNDRIAYVAFDDPAPNTFDVTAFDPLAYGGAPLAITGQATGVGGGNATLTGTVNPHGFELGDCHFEYLSEAQFLSNGEDFTGAVSVPCAEELAEIGHGSTPVAVHADLSGLDPKGRYRFKLVAENEFGVSPEGAASLFGPPVLATKSAEPVSYDEATLRATIDSSGLLTKYHFEYGTGGGYGHSTSVAELSPAAGPTDVAIPVFGLEEGAIYHYRIVVENEAETVIGPDQEFETQEMRASLPCANVEFRTGLSANLPDCRAYELVTPADTRGMTPEAAGPITHQFSDRLVAPAGEGAGDRVSFFVDGGTLPGFEGNGIFDGYRARRAEGTHPSAGWDSTLFSPSYLETAASLASKPGQEGVASDQQYSFWWVSAPEGTLDPGIYLRTPTGFEYVGQGSLGLDPNVNTHYVSPGGSHVIFSSTAHLEAATPLAQDNSEALYDRTAGDTSAKVVSLKPGEVPLSGKEKAAYMGSNEGGTAIIFKVNGVLYLRRKNQDTVEVAKAPNTFAGVSADGKHVFYVGAAVSGQVPAPAKLWAFDADSESSTEIAPNSRFVNVSGDGSHVYFTSTEVLDDSLEGSPGENNFYVWNGVDESTDLVGLLDPEDLAPLGFQGVADNLIRWPEAIAIGEVGRARSPARSTSDGSTLVFQSHSQLTLYDNTEANAADCGDPKVAGDRCAEVYRYDDEASGGGLTCVSCDPSGAPPEGDALLQDLRIVSTVRAATLIPNVTEDGSRVFFQSKDPLLPEDANSVEDVYEWQAPGIDGCKRANGCLGLISSGQGEQDSFLYGMTLDGHDVFFSTVEKLAGADITGSPSIYDARVDGGIPDPLAGATCEGDACQGEGSSPTVLPTPATFNSGPGNVKTKPSRKCPQNRRKVRRRGKVMCVTHSRNSRHKKNSHRGKGGSR
jgi:hypothetical protein